MFINSMEFDADDIKKSKFNEAALKMTRIHKLQDTINICSVDKQGYFIDINKIGIISVGKRNYEVIYECLNQLLMEVYGKLDKKEKESVNQTRNVINEFMRSKNPYKIITNLSGKPVESFTLGNWVILEEQLILYEQKIRELLDHHEVSGGNKDDDEGL